jgi:hypothetical protein
MPTPRHVGRRLCDVALVATFAVASLYATARIGLGPHDAGAGDGGGGVGVIFTPWTSGDDAMRRAVGAGARFVRYGGAPFIVVVMPESHDYRARISGALLVVDASVVSACLQLVGGASS